MPIRRWHYGKLVLLWAWGVVLIAAALKALEGIGDPQESLMIIVGYLVMAGVVAIAVALSVITWRWLSGKEVTRHERRESVDVFIHGTDRTVSNRSAPPGDDAPSN